MGDNDVAENGKFSAILMFGCPGSGKGTQGVVIGQMPNLVHLAMGDIFRGLDKESPLGRDFRAYAGKGLLVPDELTIRVFRQCITDKVADGTVRRDYHTLLLDGIPRTTSQVELLRDFIDVRRIVHLVMQDRDALIRRLSARAAKSNRPDDADPGVIRKRIEVYERETYPVLDAYPKKLIANVNADQHPLAVLRDVAESLIETVPGAI
jgi:adenylate kinase